MKELSKKDIINFLRKEEFVLSKKDATIIVDAIFDYIKDTLTTSLKDPEKSDVRLSIKGFGSFYTYSKPGQRKFNPHTRTYQDAPARRIVKFKRSKFLSHPQAKY
jgi:nucleoid DNA-binding protein